MAGRCDPIYVQLGARVRDARRATQTSQDALARVVGLSRTSITNIEKGRQPVQVHLLLKLAEALGVSAAFLLPERRSVVDPVNSKALHGLERRSREWVERILRNDEPGKEEHNASSVRGSEAERA